MPSLPRSVGFGPETSPPQGALVRHPSTATSDSSNPIRGVVALTCCGFQTVHDPGLDPLIAATSQRGCRASAVGMAPVPGAKDQDVDQQIEDHPVRDPRPVTAQRVLVAALRQQGGELFPNGLDQA
jgi:hypothetical protein